MTKEERLELTLKGSRVLRAKFDYHVNAWRIYCHTKSSGYELYANQSYTSLELCEIAIQLYCDNTTAFIFEPFNEFNFYRDGQTNQYAGTR